MIALMHLREDYAAAEIAQRLLLEYMDEIYLVPKDYRRVWKDIRGMLEGVRAAIFLMVDEDAPFDRATLNDLTTVINLQKPLYMVVPLNKVGYFERKGWKSLPNVKFFAFAPWDPGSIRKIVARIVSSGKKPRKSGKDDLVGVIIAMGLLMLLGMALSSKE